MFRILFVCAGNICRSPTAEGIMRRLIQEQGLEKEIAVDSAGTSSWHSGDAPDFRSAACAKEHGINLCDLRSRPVCAEDFAEFDLILAMDKHNLADLEYRRPREDEHYQKAKLGLILDYAPEYGREVPDPYYLNGFDRVFEMLAAACENLLSRYKSGKLS